MLSDREGVAALAMLAMYADHHIAGEEDATLRERLCQFPLFEEMPDAELGELLARLERLVRADGAERALALAAAAVPRELRPTAFLLATEIVAADGDVVLQESAYLGRLQKEMQLDGGTVERIFEVTRLRTRR